MLSPLPDHRTVLIMSLRELSRDRKAYGLLKFHQDRQEREEMNWRTKSELTVRKRDREVIINSQVRELDLYASICSFWVGFVKGDVTFCIESDGFGNK